MAKKLTMAQLDWLGIHNPSNFCRDSFYVRHIVGGYSYGWNLFVPGDPINWDSKRFGFMGRGRAVPDDMREDLEPALAKRGFTWPDEWIKFFGVWMDKAFYDKRMAELVAEYKEAAVAEGDK